jgi:putative endonuclease
MGCGTIHSTCHPERSEGSRPGLSGAEIPGATSHGGIQEMTTYYVYILASASRTLYIGVTNNLERRVYQHRTKLHEGFTAHYNLNRLVYFEVFNDVLVAIGREKQIKGWTRAKKIALIESVNRDWKDLTDQWHRGSTGTSG